MSSTLRRLFERPNVASNRSISKSSVQFSDAQRLSGDTFKVNNFEKRLLVWSGKYKRVADIPAYVSGEMVEKTRSWARIRVANIMVVFTLIGCVVMVYSGKKARKRGESLQQYNLDMHKKFNEEHRAKEKAQ